MGSKGVTAPTHYDKSHNFFIQLQGIKRFILSPPEEHSKLYLYPSLHPMRLQTQVDFFSVNREKFPKFKNIIGEEALLYPGDVLYLPPYWFHRVITEEPGVGINIWSSSNSMKVEELAKQIPIPLSKTWGISDQILGLKLYSMSIISQTLYQEPVQFIRFMTMTQFIPLFGELSLPQLECQYSELKMKQYSETWKAKLEVSITHFSELYHSIEDHHVRELEVFTYIEKLTAVCLGPENVFPFLKACFL